MHGGAVNATGDGGAHETEGGGANASHGTTTGQHAVIGETYQSHHSDVPGIHGSFDGANLIRLRTERVMAGMTLGSVAFQMSLFYLVHARDQDMKRYAYSVIGQTISIFCAVLSFNAFYVTVEEYVELLPVWKRDVIYPGIVILFFCVMEGVVLFCSRVKGEKAEKHASAGGVELHVLHSVLNAKTLGSGFAQMCGAAAIRCFGYLQLRAYSQQHSITETFAVIPLAAIVLYIFMGWAGIFRRIFARCDPVIDATAKRNWTLAAEECENEVFAFTIAFLCAVAMRALEIGSLPHILFHHHVHNLMDVPSNNCVMAMLGFSFGCALSCVALNILTFGCLRDRVDGVAMQSMLGARLVKLLLLTISYCFAWGLSFGLHFFALRFGHGLQLRLSMALATSVTAFVVIKVLDMLADMDCTGAAFNKAIVMLINSLGVTVGLSWEHAFHECVTVVVVLMAEDTMVFTASDDPKVWAVFLSSSIVMTVLPAYRWFVVPTMYSLIEHYEDASAKKEDAAYFEMENNGSYWVGATVGGSQGTEHGQTFMFESPPGPLGALAESLRAENAEHGQGHHDPLQNSLHEARSRPSQV